MEGQDNCLIKWTTGGSCVKAHGTGDVMNITNVIKSPFIKQKNLYSTINHDSLAKSGTTWRPEWPLKKKSGTTSENLGS